MKKFLFTSIASSLLLSNTALAGFSEYTLVDCNSTLAILEVKIPISYFEYREFPKIYAMFRNVNRVWYESDLQNTVHGTEVFTFRIDNYNDTTIDKYSLMIKDKNGGDHYIDIADCISQ